MRRVIGALLLAAGVAAAANTTVSGTIRDVAGVGLDGTCTVRALQTFAAAGGERVAKNLAPVTVTDGAFSIELVPGTTAVGGPVDYSMTCRLMNSRAVAETYTYILRVPASAGAVDLNDVILSTPAGSTYTVLLTQIDQGGASGNQCLIWNGTSWAPGSCAEAGSMVYPAAGVAASTGSAWGASYAIGTASGTIAAGDHGHATTYLGLHGKADTAGAADTAASATSATAAAGLAAQYVDWSASAGGASIKNKPALGGAALLGVGTAAGTVAAGDHAHAAAYAALSHGHAISEIANLQTGLDAKVNTSLLSCSSDGYVLKYRTATGWACEADQVGAEGGGITSLNGLTESAQTFAKSDDTNVTLGIVSSGTAHTFTVGWTGALAKARQHAATLYSDGAYTDPAWLTLTAAGGRISGFALSAHNHDATYLGLHAKADTAGNADTVTNGVYTNDARLTNARTPTAHASSHGSGQSDAVTVASSQVSDFTAAVRGSITAGAPIGYNSTDGQFSMSSAGPITDGYLSQSDYVSFASKAAGDHNHTGTYAPVTSGTAPLKGNGTGGTSAAAASDVAGLFSGTGDYLKSDGTKGTPTGSGDVVAGTLATSRAVPVVSASKTITESGVTIDASNMLTAPGGFTTGSGALEISGPEQAAPTVSEPTCYIDSTTHLLTCKNASDAVVGSIRALGTTAGTAAEGNHTHGQTRVCEIHIWGTGTAGVLQDADDEAASCVNGFGVTETITAVACWANAGSPTVTPIITGGAANSILTGALTCGTASFALGTLNGTPTLSASLGSIDANITMAGGTATNIRLVFKLAR